MSDIYANEIVEELNEINQALQGETVSDSGVHANPIASALAKIKTNVNGGGLPEYTAEDEGKVLAIVDTEGELAPKWESSGSGGEVPIITHTIVTGPPPTFTPISDTWDLTPEQFNALLENNDIIKVKKIRQTKSGDLILNAIESEILFFKSGSSEGGESNYGIDAIPAVTFTIDEPSYLIITTDSIYVEDEAIVEYEYSYQVDATEYTP